MDKYRLPKEATEKNNHNQLADTTTEEIAVRLKQIEEIDQGTQPKRTAKEISDAELKLLQKETNEQLSRESVPLFGEKTSELEELYISNLKQKEMNQGTQMSINRPQNELEGLDLLSASEKNMRKKKILVRDVGTPFLHLSKEYAEKQQLGAIGRDSGHPDSDESSDDNDYENTKDLEGKWRGKKSRNSRTHKEKKIIQFKIDSEVWKNCIFQNQFEKKAKILLSEGKLPGKDILDKICTKYNRKSQIVQLICADICAYIQQQSHRMVSVWAAYRYSKTENCAYGNEIIFVILTNEKVKIHVDCDFDICLRNVHELSDQSVKENIFIHQQEIREGLNDEEKHQLKKCTVRNTKRLMDKHSNLTRITLSWFKTEKSESLDNARRIPCVALYVHIKGLIPINEDPFVEVIEHYPVDIREGVFRLHGKSTDFHENVKMGCSFDTGYGTSSGTIGPFIQIIGDSSFYCLTSSHIVLMDSEFERLKDQGFIHYGRSGIDVYQPPESQTLDQEGKRYPFGRIEAAMYRQGNQTDAGMEIALLKINDDRRPIDFSFSEGREIDVEMSTDIITGLSNFTGASEVCKYGGQTGYTEGKIRVDGASVRTRTFTYSKSRILTLHRQIEVITDTEAKFGDFGDSGSLVLVQINNKFVPFGIFEGSFYEGWTCYIVTPLADIIKTIRDNMSSRLQVNASQEDMELDDDASVPLAIRIPLQQIHQERDRAQHTNTASALTAEFVENLMFHTEHKFNTVKSELSVVKNGLNELTQQNSKHEEILLKILQRLPPNPNEHNGPNYSERL